MVWPQAEPCPSSAGTAATARPSRTQTRRRCTIRMGRVSAAAQDLGAKRRSRWEAVLVWGWHRWEGGQCPKTDESPREAGCHRPNPRGQCSSPFSGLQTPLRMLGTLSPGKCAKSCARAVLRTISGGFIFSWTRTPAAESFSRTLQRLQKTSKHGDAYLPLHLYAHDVRVSHGADSQ